MKDYVGLLGASLTNQHAVWLSNKVWHTLHTLNGRRFGPENTIFDVHSGQNIRPQCEQFTYEQIGII